MIYLVLFYTHIQQYFDHIKWCNYYHDADPVSGFLDFYEVDKNVRSVFSDPKANRWGFSHVGYWDDIPMYEDIVKEYL